MFDAATVEITSGFGTLAYWDSRLAAQGKKGQHTSVGGLRT